MGGCGGKGVGGGELRNAVEIDGEVFSPCGLRIELGGQRLIAY